MPNASVIWLASWPLDEKQTTHPVVGKVGYNVSNPPFLFPPSLFPLLMLCIVGIPLFFQMAVTRWYSDWPMITTLELSGKEGIKYSSQAKTPLAKGRTTAANSVRRRTRHSRLRVRDLLLSASDEAPHVKARVRRSLSAASTAHLTHSSGRCLSSLRAFRTTGLRAASLGVK